MPGLVAINTGNGDVSWAMVAIEMVKKNHYFSYSNSSKDKIFHQKYESFTFELLLIKFSRLGKYTATKKFATSIQ